MYISQKNSREIPVYHAFFKEKKTVDFIQNWILLPYRSSYQNICIAYIFRITHPVKLIEKLILWWWTLFGWLHVKYQYRLRLIFYGDNYKYQDTFFVNRHIFFETLFFLSQRFAFANPRLYVIRWYGKPILISTDCTCIIHCARTLSLILT